MTGRKKLGRKRYTSNRDDCKLENTDKQSWFKHLWELHKEWTEAGVSASRVTTLRRLQEKGYQATSEPETTSEASYLGCGEKELDCCSVVQSPQSFQMKVNFAFHLEIKVWSLEEDWRGTESKLLYIQIYTHTHIYIHSNEGMLNCFIESLLYYCIKSSPVLSRVSVFVSLLLWYFSQGVS